MDFGAGRVEVAVGPSSGLIVRVMVGILLLCYAAVRLADSGPRLSLVLPAAIGLFFVVRGLATSGRR
jgi:hypothetical protein